MAPERRLAAIMFTDIVGYTSLMGSDEEKALKVLRKNREVHRPLIKKYRGEWLKEMGDGILASFHTSSDAVRCAGEIQNAARREGIALRIGIHEGEVLFEGGDVLGDGVNVASRLEELAGEGSVYVSGAVYKDIKNKAGITAEFIEEYTLKNVEDPVKVYLVRFEEDWQDISAPKPISKKISGKKLIYQLSALLIILTIILIWRFYPGADLTDLRTDDQVEKSIAVIPFWNDSPDPDNAYFCSGMEEEIRIHLLKISDLLIESRQSVEKYRENPEKDIVSIGKELEVSYIVEGSVRKAGEEVRVTVQLIDAKTGDHIWGDTYDGDYSHELLAYQSNTAKKIASTVHAVITPEEEKRIDNIPTDKITAYDFALRGDEMFSRFYAISEIRYLNSSLDFYNKALEIDPGYARALAGKGDYFLYLNDLDSAIYYVKGAMNADPGYAHAYDLMGAYYRRIGQYDEAIQNYLKSIQLMPNNWWVNYVLGNIYIRNNSDIVQGLPYIQKAFELCTENREGMYVSIGISFFNIDDFEKAEYYYSKALELNADCGIVMYFGWLYHSQGDFQKALEIEESLCNRMDCEVRCYQQYFYSYMYLKEYELAYKYYRKSIEAGRDSTYLLDRVTASYVLREMGRKDESDRALKSIYNELKEMSRDHETSTSNLLMAFVYAMKDDKNKALEHLLRFERFGYSSWFNEIKIFPLLENLWDEPEFKALVQRIDNEKADLRKKIREMEARGEISF